MRSPHRRRDRRAGGLPLCRGAGGFALAQIRDLAGAAPMLDRPLGPVALEGRVVDVEALAEGLRSRSRPADRPAGAAHAGAGPGPAARRQWPPPTIGDRLQLKASLMPPPGPALPAVSISSARPSISGWAASAMRWAAGSCPAAPKAASPRRCAIRRP
jgi:hypothetical protein